MLNQRRNRFRIGWIANPIGFCPIRSLGSSFLFLATCIYLHAGDVPSNENQVDFARDISPILSNNCYFCHGPDANHRKAGLRLDVREEAIDFAAVVPEDIESSELVNRIEHDDPKWIMPPPESHKTLTEKEKGLLKRWIAEGAPYADHWSFTPIKRPDPPASETAKANKNPIDAFIEDRLRGIGADLSPRVRADRLIRRLSLDLVGLPPTPDQVKRFVGASAINSESAYQSLLEELLASPHHGERMASFWLDVVRYSDTVGYHGDQTQNIFPYRDWVVEAFNANMPFDEFTRKQLAGDLLPGATTDDLVASGFNRLNMMTREGGAQPGEYLSKYAADRVRTVGMAWMGLTTGCAECHDHKFDPFTAKDFYSLGAFFADLKQWGVYSDYGYTPNKDLKGFNNNFPFPPEIEVVSEALVRQQAGYRQQLVSASRSLLDGLSDEDRSRAGEWHRQLIAWLDQSASGWKRPARAESEGDPDKKTKQKPRRFEIIASSLAFGKQDGLRTKSVRVSFPAPSDGKERKLEVRFFVETPQADKPPERRSVKVADAIANRFLPSFSSTIVIDSVAGSWAFPSLDSSGDPIGIGEFRYFLNRSQSSGEPMRAVFEFEQPIELKNEESFVVEVSGGENLSLEIETAPIGRLRPFDGTETEALAGSESLSDAAAVSAWALTHRRTDPNLRRLIADYRACRDGRTFTMVAQASEPITMRVLPRGNWQDESGDVVQPAVPEFLQIEGEGNANESGKRLTRLDLAQWLVSPENPLTARVVVNRLWKQFFGNGITEAADDLGAQGDPPSHPKLLDYLASELIESDWNLRHVIRLIVNSHTYQQDSKRRTAFNEVDPENRLLSFHPPRRLEAESIRDNALAIAGLLNPEIGGPAIKPYQPAGYYSNLQFPNRTYVATGDRSQYRRGLYMHWQRTFLHPMLANFDAPSREDCVAIRANANTPQQALTLLNDPTFVEAAGQFAWNTLVDQPRASDEIRLRAMIEQAVQREANSDEIARLTEFLNQQREVFAAKPELVDELASIGLAGSFRDWTQLTTISNEKDDQRAEWAAWTATARILLNLHETITRF